jgi:hypothetical protein
LPVIEGAEVLALAPRVQRAANVSIRSLAAARPVLLTGQDDAAQTISITLARSGVVDGASTSTLAIYALDASGRGAPTQRDVELGRATHTWAPGQREVTLTVAVTAARPAAAPSAISSTPSTAPPADSGVLIAELLSDDALPADNRAALPLLTREVLRVGLIDGPSSIASGNSVGAIGGSLRPAQWARLALRPSDSSPIEVTTIEPLAVDAGRLASLDALWILSPDALDAGAWRRIAAWHRAGNLLIISPPAGLTNHTWASASVGASAGAASGTAAGDGAQPMAAALGLDLSLPLTATIAPDEQPWRLALTPPTSDDLADLLAPIRGEMAELVRPVGLTRLLASDLAARPLTAESTPTAPPASAASAAPAHSARVLLATTDGRPVVTAWRARASAANAPNATPSSSPGIIVYLSFAPEASWADIVAKPLMVPLVQELVRQGVGLSRPGRAIIAGEAMGLARRAPQGASSPATSPAASPSANLGSSPALTLQPLDGAPALTLRSDAGPTRAGIYRLASASTAPDGPVAEPSLLVVNPALADTSTVDRQQATAALAAIAPRVDGQVDAPLAGIRLIDERGQALAAAEGPASDASPSASASPSPAQRQGAPIGAGVSLLWIVLALALVESALAWSTARRGVASAARAVPARSAPTGGGAA